jgi:Fur family ferric uptake transcriptional regulator
MTKALPAHAARIPEAQGRIRAASERLTGPRAAVLAVLLASRQALSHHDIEAALKGRHAVDRVTVYRVLEWLVELGLAHRIAGDDRTWRFHASGDAGHPHAHFTCSQCGKTVCLDDVAVPRPVKVPKGYVSREVRLNITGLCASCH